MAKSPQQILLVEDDPDIQIVAQMGLEVVGGFTVTVSSSGLEAIDTAPKLLPDLILLDAMMPGMDGISTLKALRQIETTANIPIIFLTASVQTHQVAQYKELGALDVIAKPFDPMTLSESIHHIWTKYYD